MTADASSSGASVPALVLTPALSAGRALDAADAAAPLPPLLPPPSRPLIRCGLR
jgi:hypothetical protein